MAAEVGRHDHHGVLEVDRPAFAVGQSPIIQQLQQDVQDLRMRFLDFVEQHDRVRPAPHRFGQLSGVLVPDVSRRRADHPRDGVLLLILRHVDAHHRLLVVEQKLRERARQLRLADAGRTEEEEAAERTVGILQPRAGAADRICHRVDRFVLADDAMVQTVFHLDQLLDFAFHQPADGDVRPLADDVRDILLVDFFLQHALALLQLGQLQLLVLDLFLELRHAAVLQLRGLRVVAGALRPLNLDAQRFLILFQLARSLNRVFLLLPVRRELRALFLRIRELLLQLCQPLARCGVFFFSQRLAFDLELHDAALELVELRRHRVNLHAQLRRGFVDEIDRLVRQEAIGDVAVGQDGRRDERRVLELHAVMDFVPLAQAAEDADRVLDARLADHDRLETPLERRVLLDVLAVLVERGCANRVELAAREHRLQHVRRIDRTLGRAGADHGVELVDEQDDLAFGVGDLLEDRLQPLLELAAIFRTGDERTHVERDDSLVLEPFGDIAADDAAGEPFDNRRLADARFADEDRIVLRPPRQHLDDASDFLVSTDHRIEFAFAGELGEIAPVALQRLIRTFRILSRDALGPSNAGERLKNRIARDPMLL